MEDRTCMESSTTTRGRPALTRGSKKAKKLFKNVHVTYTKKLETIECFDTNGIAVTMARHFGHLTGTRRESARKKIYKWLELRQHIQEMATNKHTSNHKCSRALCMATTLPHEAEEQLARWVSSMRKDGVPVTPQMLQIMGLEAATDLGLDDVFQASRAWMMGFLNRFNLSLRARTRVGQDTQEDGQEVLANFSRRVQAVVEEHNIDVIYNADQTGVNYEYLPTKTISGRGDKTVWIKCGGKTKDRATAMVLADSTGKKYPLVIVLKTTSSKIKEVVQQNLSQRQGFGKLVWKEVEPLQDMFNCRVFGNPSAWWNASISVEFLKFHFEDRPDRATKKVLLLWDDFSAHFTDVVLKCAAELNVVLEKVPPRFTWICQPADVAWIRPMKSRLRSFWIDMIKRQVRTHKSDQVTFKLIAPLRSTIVQRVTQVWDDLPRSTILNGFGKCKLIDRIAEVDDVENHPLDDTCWPSFLLDEE
ncbi:Aste57867_1761 [Aphanomyces stellatus]|uniref:Aste57867_1761 protein n=1 Tax=Aphanomyces stellatus TaxID=120398 RepID=A0A485K622_9STRA|nr:hypothetical protein As57867_001759 [Aphanomyces stellatus]VFT78970.1 Aste57867_1761 [Aphanomyces stellatus]